MHIEILHVHKYISVKIYENSIFPHLNATNTIAKNNSHDFSKRHLGFSASQSLWKPGVSQILPHWGATPNWETPSRILPSTGITLQSLYMFSMNVYAQRNKEVSPETAQKGNQLPKNHFRGSSGYWPYSIWNHPWCNQDNIKISLSHCLAYQSSMHRNLLKNVVPWSLWVCGVCLKIRGPQNLPYLFKKTME